MCSWEHIRAHRSPINCLPRSGTMLTGTPYLNIQVWMKVLVTVAVLMSSRSAISIYLVFLSIMVSRYRNPWEGVEGWWYRRSSWWTCGSVPRSPGAPGWHARWLWTPGRRCTPYTICSHHHTFVTITTSWWLTTVLPVYPHEITHEPAWTLDGGKPRVLQA